MVPGLCQFTEISCYPVCVNLQRFHGALFASNLQRFYDALFLSIYRDFVMPCLCQFTEILYVSLQRFRFENSVQLFLQTF